MVLPKSNVFLSINLPCLFDLKMSLICIIIQCSQSNYYLLKYDLSLIVDAYKFQTCENIKWNKEEGWKEGRKVRRKEERKEEIKALETVKESHW